VVSDTPRLSQSDNPRVLIYSQRNLLSILPFRCAHFEFENVISHIDSADILAPRIDPSNLRHIVAKRIAYHSSLALNPGIQRIPIERDYELFLAICGDPTDLLRVSALGNWRSRCRKSVCLIDELWVTQMDSYHSFLRLLEAFDVVMLYYSQSVGQLSKRIGSQCAYLPPGVDTIRFCPYPKWPKRVIDVYSVGRRSKITHRTLLKMVQEDGLFYLHDSIVANQVLDPMEHRALFANIAKRSRYFIVNPGLIDRRDIRGDQIEIGDRYFEAAASGAILLGERPDNPEFTKLFGWPDSMIHLLFDSPDIDKIVKTLDDDPAGQERMRRRNVKEALMRHDWAYRWEIILGAVGLEPMPELFQRKERLRQLAEDITQSESSSGHYVSEVKSK
jgi:spore maturation protein CgeB